MFSQIELDAAPKAMLNGVAYPVPRLVPRQQRIIMPKIMSLMKSMTVDGKVSPLNLTTEQYDDLLDVVFIGIQRATPALTRDEFLDTPINLLELIRAMDVISEASGLFKRQKPGGVQMETVVTGEALATSSGTPSSQE